MNKKIYVLVCDNDKKLFTKLLTDKKMFVYYCSEKEEVEKILDLPFITFDVFIINPIINKRSSLSLIERLIKEKKTIIIVSDILKKDFVSDLLNSMVKFEKVSEFKKIKSLISKFI